MTVYTLPLRAIAPADLPHVGGKAANLAALAGIAGVAVPDGFCVTTDAFARIVAAAGPDPAAIRVAAIPPDLAAEMAARLAEYGEAGAYAVRSSATAEDLPAASFAGQHDTRLNVTGLTALLDALRVVWASGYSDAAVSYRLAHGFDPRDTRLAVVVQRMVDADAAGVLFTADPLSGRRTLTAIDATRGLGAGLVGGTVNADHYQVRDDPPGGTVIARGAGQTLTDADALRLARLGRVIEAHFGRPQDIEWALAGGDVFILQSRPITTLFPIPVAPDDRPRVYLSVGHQQMMTDAMRPLGWSMWQMLAGRPMFEAGGRLFVDVTAELAAPASRAALVEGVGRADPLTKDALLTVLARDFIPLNEDAPPPLSPALTGKPAAPDPSVDELIAASAAALAELKQAIPAFSGAALFDFIREDIARLRRQLADPRSMAALLAAMNSAAWLNARLAEWLGEPAPADTLAQSAPGNVTAEMGLALLDVADALRPHPAVVDYLAQTRDTAFLNKLPDLPGGAAARAAILAFLDKYGARGAGEIDITRARWSEEPGALLPALLGNVRHFAPGEGRRRFAQGELAATRKTQELLARLRELPDGAAKAQETAAMIDRLRRYTGYREHPKFAIVSRTAVYRQALLREAARLVEARVIDGAEDAYYLTFDELRTASRDGTADRALIARRRADHLRYTKLAPPRVLTSDGEALTGAYQRGPLPPGALAGLPVSAGVVEGRARILRDLAAADLAPGDILVTPYTDPAWTPLFVTIAGLVTEVGGLVTHGAVIAREYGLPAVVAVPDATRRIPDRARIRVDGTTGVVEVLG